MLICVECETVFEREHAKRVVERHGLDTPPYEEFLSCPHCGGINLHQARRCDVCSEWITGGYVKTLDGERICDACYTSHDIEDD